MGICVLTCKDFTGTLKVGLLCHIGLGILVADDYYHTTF